MWSVVDPWMSPILTQLYGRLKSVLTSLFIRPKKSRLSCLSARRSPINLTGGDDEVILKMVTKGDFAEIVKVNYSAYLGAPINRGH